MKRKNGEAIDLTKDSDSDDDRKKMPPKRKYRHYGSSADEILDYIGHTSRVRELTREMRPMTMHQQAEVIIMLSASQHWMAIGVDTAHQQYAFMGARDLQSWERWMRESGLIPEEMIDVTPQAGAQDESECGARVAVFAKWFLEERDYNDNRGRRQIPGFRDRARRLMATWRQARRDRI